MKNTEFIPADFDAHGRLRLPLLFWCVLLLQARTWVLFLMAGASRQQGDAILNLFYPDHERFWLGLLPGVPAVLAFLLSGYRQRLPRLWRAMRWLLVLSQVLLLLWQPMLWLSGESPSSLTIALLVALISAAMYGVFLLIQTKTHQSLFVYEHEDDGDDDDPHHGKPSAHSSVWHTVWLIVHLIAVIAVTKMNANPLETLLTELNAPVAFTGFLVALLILSPEGLGALKAVLNNQVQRAMNLFFGSVLATISLTVPVVTLIAFMTGNELQFALGAPEMIVMVASLLLCQISFSTGRTNVLNGAAHMALFVAYLMTIFA